MGATSCEGAGDWFRRLLAWVAAAGIGPTFGSRRCSCVDDVVVFCEGLGGRLALLYVVGATDVREEHLLVGLPEPERVDVAGLFRGGQAGSVAASRQSGEPGARGVARDVLERSVFRLGLLAARSPPLLRGQPVDLLAYAEDLVRGFECMYVGLWRNRELLLGADGPLSACRGDGGVGARGIPAAALMTIERRVEALGVEDLGRQRWLLRASFVSLVGSALKSEEPRRLWAGARVSEHSGRERFVRAACVVAERLEVLAVETRSEVTWLGIAPATNAEAVRWTAGPLGIDLHSGLAGVVWFLARLSSVTGDGRWRRLAGRAAQAWVTQAAERGSVTSVGAFAGWGGLVYVAAHLFSLWRERVWLERAAGWRSRIVECLSCDRDYDVATGSAGAILGLAALQASEWTECTRDAIRACAEHLLARAPPMSEGVAFGLSVAATETGDSRYTKAARRVVGGGSGVLVPGLPLAWRPGFDHVDLGADLDHLERLVSRGAWRCGTPWGIETPGLMLGLAGLGDRLLRAGEPSLPGVLALEPPPKSCRL
jgi:hypothetical protein